MKYRQTCIDPSPARICEGKAEELSLVLGPSLELALHACDGTVPWYGARRSRMSVTKRMGFQSLVCTRPTLAAIVLVQLSCEST